MQSIDDLDFSKTYTYADYYSWTFEERVELIRGSVFKMVNYPDTTFMGTNHQIILGNIAGMAYTFLKNRKVGYVYMAPFDVRLIDKSSYDEDITNVVQPDLSFFLDRKKLDERGAIGTPDIVIEILIAGSNLVELKQKFQLYEDFGVTEYWIVSSQEQSILKYCLDENGKYVAGRALTSGDNVTTSILPGFELALDDVFHGLI